MYEKKHLKIKEINVDSLYLPSLSSITLPFLSVALFHYLSALLTYSTNLLFLLIIADNVITIILAFQSQSIEIFHCLPEMTNQNENSH